MTGGALALRGCRYWLAEAGQSWLADYGPFVEDGGTGPEDMIRALTEALHQGPLVFRFEAPMYIHAKRDIQATIQ